MDSSNIIHDTCINLLGSGASTEEGRERYQPLRNKALEEELSFYAKYPWSLQVFPTVRDVIEHLREELAKVALPQREWQAKEAETNIFLLSCAICEAVDDYLLGVCYDLSKVASVLRFATPILRGAERLLKIRRMLRERSLRRLRSWRKAWDNALDEFLRGFIAGRCTSKTELQFACYRLAGMLPPPFPVLLLSRRPRVPAALHSQDLTHYDILTLGDKLAGAFPDREQPLLLVGLRTAGSYFAPMLSSCLKLKGYQHVTSVTVRPKSGISHYELRTMETAAKGGALAVVIDEPPGTGSTLLNALDCLHSVGFHDRGILILVPVHPTMRDWRNGGAFQPFSSIQVLSLEPEEYYKYRALEPDIVEQRLSEYFRGLGYSSTRVVEGSRVVEFNRYLSSLSEEKSQNRLKRVYEVRLQKPAGEAETRWVVVKSVGWGWFSYHAFLTGDRLAEFVPPVLGLRDGLLYSEWLSSQEHPRRTDRIRLIRKAASYVAERARTLTLADDPVPDLALENRNLGLEKLTDMLTRVYGSKIASNLRRGRIQYELSRQPTARPTFIDGKMRGIEWILSDYSIYKTDFEQHGLGKFELSSTDPAYDLAEVVLEFHLTPSEEKDLIDHYIEQCGDIGVKQRLFLKKLQTGSWALSQAFGNLCDPRVVHRHHEFHQRYMAALRFMVIHTTRHAARLCSSPLKAEWRTPVVVLDIDGVLDKQSFGFPSTSAAGIRAISQLQAHRYSIAINTARSIEEVREYCRSYGFAGGIAEYGGWIWDAVNDRERVLVRSESLEQLQALRGRIRNIPGVFVNDDYRYSLKAFVYAHGTTVPLPEGVIQDLMASLKLDRLRLRQTFTDSTVTAKDSDKGKGLLELLSLVGDADLETIAVGDSEADLAMFAVASRCFAPSNISCKQAARLLGCQIASKPYQCGLLSIVETLLHPDRERCDRCRDLSFPDGTDVFWKLLQCADRSRQELLFHSIFDPMAIKAFVK